MTKWPSRICMPAVRALQNSCRKRTSQCRSVLNCLRNSSTSVAASNATFQVQQWSSASHERFGVGTFTEFLSWSVSVIPPFVSAVKFHSNFRVALLSFPPQIRLYSCRTICVHSLGICRLASRGIYFAGVPRRASGWRFGPVLPLSFGPCTI